MWYASSALRRFRAALSTSEYTATEEMPRLRQARITRNAISPRLAIRIFLNVRGSPEVFQRSFILPEFRWAAILDAASSTVGSFGYHDYSIVKSTQNVS